MDHIIFADDDGRSLRNLFPQDYYKKFIERGVRPDGRRLNRTRKTDVSQGLISCAAGSSMARIGRTTFITAIMLQVGQPAQNAPRSGEVDIQVHFTPLCSSSFATGKQSDQALALGSYLTRIIVGSKALNLEHLCIEEGFSAWMLRVDAFCLDYDGNATDTALLSVLAALQDLRLPSIEISTETKLVTITEGPSRTLELCHAPYSLTFAIVDGHILADPSQEEEKLASGMITIPCTSSGGLCGIQKTGTYAVSWTKFAECVEEAKMRAHSMLEMVEAASLSRANESS